MAYAEAKSRTHSRRARLIHRTEKVAISKGGCSVEADDRPSLTARAEARVVARKTDAVRAVTIPT